MKKHLFRITLGLMWIIGILCMGKVNAKSETIYITGFDNDTSGQLIQVNEQSREDLELYFLNRDGTVSHFTIMDRNVGATETYNGIRDSQNNKSYGYVYQWGNNYGFTSTATPTLTEPTKGGVEKIIWEIYIPSKFGRNAYNTSANWMLNASTTDGIWGGTGDTSLTNGSGTTKEGRKGPCPNGYYVPSSKDWSDIIAWYTLKESTDNMGQQLAGDLLIPAAGNRARGNGGNTVLYVGELGCYRSSSPYEYSSNYAYSFNFGLSSANPRSNSYRSQGRPVRCKKNSANNTEFVLHPNGGTGAVIAFTGDINNGIFTTLGSPNRGNSIFLGWYSTPDFQEGTKIEKGDTVVSNLYAKWECAEGYESNKGNTGCLETFNILYELNNAYILGENPSTYTIESDNIILIEPTKTGYTFTGRSGTDIELLRTSVTIPTGSTGDRSYEANWEVNQYTITFDAGGSITTITGEYDSPVTPPANPSKIGYKFIGREPEIPDRMPAEDMTIKAIWEELGTSGGGGGGGGGSGDTPKEKKSDETSEQPSQNESNTENVIQSETKGSEESSNTPMDSSANALEGQNYSEEFQQAYEFAKGKGITTMPTIQKAQMNSPLTRIAMAKMLSQYAINVLGMKPDETKNNKFNDVSDKRDSDYNSGVTLAYQLGIMGQNMPNNKFRPDDEVTRAEFATALSRMIYGTSDGEYKGTGKYYIHHMEKLVEEGIITKDDPRMKELRGYVMIMLMRSSK